MDKKQISKVNGSKKGKEDKKKWSFTKKAIFFVLLNSELQIWASYLLAFLGKDAIAEALSQQIVITIIGTIIGYFAKSLIENLSKYTSLFGKNLDCEGTGDSEEIKNITPDLSSDSNKGQITE